MKLNISAGLFIILQMPSAVPCVAFMTRSSQNMQTSRGFVVTPNTFSQQVLMTTRSPSLHIRGKRRRSFACVSAVNQHEIECEDSYAEDYDYSYDGLNYLFGVSTIDSFHSYIAKKIESFEVPCRDAHMAAMVTSMEKDNGQNDNVSAVEPQASYSSGEEAADFDSISSPFMSPSFPVKQPATASTEASKRRILRRQNAAETVVRPNPPTIEHFQVPPNAPPHNLHTTTTAHANAQAPRPNSGARGERKLITRQELNRQLALTFFASFAGCLGIPAAGEALVAANGASAQTTAPPPALIDMIHQGLSGGPLASSTTTLGAASPALNAFTAPPSSTPSSASSAPTTTTSAKPMGRVVRLGPRYLPEEEVYSRLLSSVAELEDARLALRQGRFALDQAVTGPGGNGRGDQYFALRESFRKPPLKNLRSTTRSCLLYLEALKGDNESGVDDEDAPSRYPVASTLDLPRGFALQANYLAHLERMDTQAGRVQRGETDVRKDQGTVLTVEGEYREVVEGLDEFLDYVKRALPTASASAS